MLRPVRGSKAFTLLELIVVIVILGILAAIAIPTFLNQREKAWAKAAQSDLRNSATVMEEIFSENGTYSAAGTLAKFKTSGDTGDVVLSGFASATAYCLVANHAKLSDNYVLLSSKGKPEKDAASTTCTAASVGTGGAAIA